MKQKEDARKVPGYCVGSWVRCTQFFPRSYFHDLPYGRLVNTTERRRGYWDYETIVDGKIKTVSRPISSFILFHPDYNPIPVEDEAIWSLHIMKG
jgi:hypothetical protein